MVNHTDKCLKCGDCCEAIPMLFSLDDLRGQYSQEDLNFLQRNWHPIELPVKSANRFAGKIFESARWFACDMFDGKRRLCKCHETRPQICRNYPAYSRKEDLISDRCGFMPKPFRRTNG